MYCMAFNGCNYDDVAVCLGKKKKCADVHVSMCMCLCSSDLQPAVAISRRLSLLRRAGQSSDLIWRICV